MSRLCVPSSTYVDVTSTQVARVVAGPNSDRFGGARVTQVSGIGMLGIFLFAGIGNASRFKQIPMAFPQHQSDGVIGWTAAIAAYGPFVFGVLIGAASASTRIAARILPRTRGVLRDQHRPQLVSVRPPWGEDTMLIPTHQRQFNRIDRADGPRCRTEQA